MPFLAMPEAVQVELRCRLFDVPCETTVTFVKHQVTISPTLLTASLAASLWWGGQMMPLLSSELLWVGVTATDISIAAGASVKTDLPTAIPGGIVVRSLPANVAVRVNYQVARPSQGLLGCMFLPGVPANQVAGNTIMSSWKDAIFEAANSLIDSAVLQGWRWVVESKFEAGQLRPEGVPFEINTASVTGAFVGQRRRRLHNEVFP